MSSKPTAEVKPIKKSRHVHVGLKDDGLNTIEIFIDEKKRFSFRLLQWVQYKDHVISKEHEEKFAIFLGYETYLSKGENQYFFLDSANYKEVGLLQEEFIEFQKQMSKYEIREQKHFHDSQVKMLRCSLCTEDYLLWTYGYKKTKLM